jgi:hypothetical protein
MASAAKYAHEDAGESERPLRVCAEAGRKCVRNIQQYPILSVEWIALVDSLKQLTRLVQLEGRMPANTKVAEAAGRNQDSDGTLWDQEAHENAIRILVEEAKVNLCLRMMTEYKMWQYNPAERTRTMTEAVAAYEFNELQLEQKCRMFEESLGVLLMKAFQHVETLQLMDIPMLIEYLTQMYSKCEQTRQPEQPPHGGKVQETLVTLYFSSLMTHAEELNNGELLAKAREQNLVQWAAHHVLNTSSEIQGEVLLAAAQGFAALADNEDFRTHWEQFFLNEHGQLDLGKKDTFMLLEDRVANEVLKTSPEKKRDLRPLLDFFNEIRRKYGA